MTPNHVTDIFVRRGFKAAMTAARISQDFSAMREVMILSYMQTGMAKPVEVSRKVGRKNVTVGVREGATAEELAIVQATIQKRGLGRREAPVVQKLKVPAKPRIPHGLSPREWEIRKAAAFKRAA